VTLGFSQTAFKMSVNFGFEGNSKKNVKILKCNLFGFGLQMFLLVNFFEIGKHWLKRVFWMKL
jgi:hypothetical protein